MEIRIQSRGFTLTGALHERSEHALRCALAHATQHVAGVRVRLYDVNGPRGGEDKRCTVVVFLENGSDVVIEDTAADLYQAVDRAAQRAGRAVARRLDRRRTFTAPRRAPELRTEAV